jgi:hypothetical protein
MLMVSLPAATTGAAITAIKQTINMRTSTFFMRFSFQNRGFELSHGPVGNLPSKKTMTGKGLVVSFTNICTKKFESIASNF